MTDFNFEPKRILKHKNHVTLNEGDKYDATVQHLEKKGEEFVELKKNEAARKYGSKKLTRELDFNSRDGLQIKESGLENTPEWFPQILPFIEWEEYRTLLYEMDHLWMNMFFVRELYGEEQKGREQIVELKSEDNGLGLNVLAELDYQPKYKDVDYKDGDVDAFIKVSIDKEQKENKAGQKGREYGIDVDFKQSYWSKEDDVGIISGLREIITGIALKHDHTDEQLHLDITEQEDGYLVQVLNKDFALRFNEEGSLETGVSPWVCEMLNWDGCPLNMETIKVTE